MKLTGTLSFALIAMFGLATQAAAECVYPKTPASAPNGSTATEAEMVAGKRAIDAYQKEVNVYLDCLKQEADARIVEAGDNADQVKQIKAILAKKHNAAIDELTARADEFNQQLREFKKKSKS